MRHACVSGMLLVWGGCQSAGREVGGASVYCDPDTGICEDEAWSEANEGRCAGAPGCVDLVEGREVCSDYVRDLTRQADYVLWATGEYRDPLDLRFTLRGPGGEQVGDVIPGPPSFDGWTPFDHPLWQFIGPEKTRLCVLDVFPNGSHGKLTFWQVSALAPPSWITRTPAQLMGAYGPPDGTAYAIVLRAGQVLNARLDLGCQRGPGVAPLLPANLSVWYLRPFRIVGPTIQCDGGRGCLESVQVTGCRGELRYEAWEGAIYYILVSPPGEERAPYFLDVNLE